MSYVQALGITGDPHSFLVVLPTASCEGYILTPEKKMVDLLSDEQIEFAEVCFLPYFES